MDKEKIREITNNQDTITKQYLIIFIKNPKSEILISKQILRQRRIRLWRKNTNVQNSCPSAGKTVWDFIFWI
jgi:4-hydroxy-3-methylbut-2-en-1-yl diphosphate synthase IspG/GcpE